MSSTGLSSHSETQTQTKIYNTSESLFLEARFPDGSQFVIRQKSFIPRCHQVSLDTGRAIRAFLLNEVRKVHQKDMMDVFQFLGDIAKRSGGADEWLQKAVEEFPTEFANRAVSPVTSITP